MHRKLKYFILSATLLIIFAVILKFFVFEKSSSPVVNAEDVRAFLRGGNNPQLDAVNKRMDFFKSKVQADNFGTVTTNMLANTYNTRFGLTGNINDLIISDSLLEITCRKYNGTKSSIFLELSVNALARHEFKKSVDNAYSAYILGEHKSLAEGMLFDAYIETGEYEQARRMLNSIKDEKEFPYLIRASKYKEVTGDMDSAAIFMNLALDIAKSNPTRPGLITWTEDALAAIYYKMEDYDNSYKHYIAALKIDSHDHKALQGIALIAAVNDKNYELADEILIYLSGKMESPDPYLNLYKVAKLKGDDTKKTQYLEKFIKLSSNPLYGRMYNKYLAEIYADEYADFTKAISIAQSEIDERPTPSSYFLLSWVYYKQGDTQKAVEIIKNNVEDKTYDPEILSKIDRIYLDETKRM